MKKHCQFCIIEDDLFLKYFNWIMLTVTKTTVYKIAQHGFLAVGKDSPLCGNDQNMCKNSKAIQTQKDQKQWPK